jgi:ankyrin repeat protein
MSNTDEDKLFELEDCNYDHLFKSNFENLHIKSIYEKELKELLILKNEKDFEELLHSCIVNDINFIKRYFDSFGDGNKRATAIDVNSVNCNGASLLHTSIANSKLDIVKYLVLEQRASIKLKNSHYGTPIFTACVCVRTEILKFLIERGANIEKRNKTSETPIIYAARHKNIEAVRVLINSGADYNIETPQGKTIFDYLIGKNAKSVKKLIRHIESSYANIKPAKH